VTRYMLDTNIVSYLAKGVSPALDERFRQCSPEDVCISVITEAEQRYGFERLDPSHRIRRVVSDLMARIEIVPWDSTAAVMYAPIRRQLELQRQQIGEFDTMIAAHAMAIGTTLVTNNVRHFSRIPGKLQLENWLEVTEPGALPAGFVVIASRCGRPHAGCATTPLLLPLEPGIASGQ